MRTDNSVQKYYLRYRAEDFPLYVFSLMVAAAVVIPIVPYLSVRIAIAGMLAYLAILFVTKHGATVEVRTVATLFSGVAQYPMILVRAWWFARGRLLQVFVVFALAVAVEQLARPALVGTQWLAPFPWWWVVWVPFIAITVFRLTILVAHLHRATHVREILESSPIKKSLVGASIQNHILHAFITGFLSHLCLIAPCVLFYYYTEPSYLRETLLIGGWLLWCGLAFALNSSGATPRKPFARHLFTALTSQVPASFELFYHSHEVAHRSRFYFAMFHGHHHDAIPSSMIGSAGGAGLLENTDRSLVWADPFASVILTQLCWAINVTIDMLLHQYIPGVFPFSKLSIAGGIHHVAHHYGSLHPLGVFTRFYVDATDVESGYDSRNARVRWYLDTVERQEGLDSKHREEFETLRAPISTHSESQPQ